MRVGICDFPSQYAFPPYGCGRIERWLWAVAVGVGRTGAEVHLIGLGWRRDLPVRWGRTSARLEDVAPGSQVFASVGLVPVLPPYLPAWMGA